MQSLHSLFDARLIIVVDIDVPRSDSIVTRRVCDVLVRHNIVL